MRHTYLHIQAMSRVNKLLLLNYVTQGKLAVVLLEGCRFAAQLRIYQHHYVVLQYEKSIHLSSLNWDLFSSGCNIEIMSWCVFSS